MCNLWFKFTDYVPRTTPLCSNLLLLADFCIWDSCVLYVRHFVLHCEISLVIFVFCCPKLLSDRLPRMSVKQWPYLVINNSVSVEKSTLTLKLFQVFSNTRLLPSSITVWHLVLHSIRPRNTPTTVLYNTNHHNPRICSIQILFETSTPTALTSMHHQPHLSESQTFTFSFLFCRQFIIYFSALCDGNSKYTNTWTHLKSSTTASSDSYWHRNRTNLAQPPLPLNQLAELRSMCLLAKRGHMVLDLWRSC